MPVSRFDQLASDLHLGGIVDVLDMPAEQARSAIAALTSCGHGHVFVVDQSRLPAGRVQLGVSASGLHCIEAADNPGNPHVTTLHHDGFKHYFTCAAGDVGHTDNAYDTPTEAEVAAKAHRDAHNPGSTCPTCGKSTTGSEGWSTGQCDDCHLTDTTTREGRNMRDNERWMVVDKNRTPIHTGMHSRDNAQSEADRLNDDGLPEFRPYRVVPGVVAEST